MSTFKHTPEPWHISGIHPRNIHIGSMASPMVLASMNDIHTQTPENAARIVACVNACAGIDDPAAEIAGLRANYKELCDIRADKVLFLPRPGYSEGAISINLSVAEQEGAIRDKLADMGWARPDEAKQLRAENARLRSALRVLVDVADGAAITYNIGTMDKWIDKARAALASDARTEVQS